MTLLAGVLNQQVTIGGTPNPTLTFLASAKGYGTVALTPGASNGDDLIYILGVQGNRDPGSAPTNLTETVIKIEPAWTSATDVNLLVYTQENCVSNGNATWTIPSSGAGIVACFKVEDAASGLLDTTNWAADFNYAIDRATFNSPAIASGLSSGEKFIRVAATMHDDINTEPSTITGWEGSSGTEVFNDVLTGSTRRPRMVIYTGTVSGASVAADELYVDANNQPVGLSFVVNKA